MIFNPDDFGVVGQGDDTLAIQGAINAVRQDGKGVIELRRAYNFGSLNATYCSNLEIECEIGAVHTCSALQQPAVLLDLWRSHNVVINRLVVTGAQPGLSGIVYPKAALLLGKADKVTINNLTVNGTFSSGVFCDIGTGSVSVRDSQLINWDPSAPTVSLSNQPDWGITSLFANEPLSHMNMPDVFFDNTEIHQLGDAQWTTYLRNADHITFRGGLSSNRQRAHLLFQGQSKHVLCDSVKYYCELPGNAQMLYECGGGSSVTGMVVVNPSRDGIPILTGGTGSFPYFSVIPSQS